MGIMDFSMVKNGLHHLFCVDSVRMMSLSHARKSSYNVISTTQVYYTFFIVKQYPEANDSINQ
jgi:3-polyprenyl-4-hydroxybenzoate decarboxylase